MATKQQIRHYAETHNVTREEAKQHFINEAINRNSKDIDVMLRMYDGVGRQESECGTIRVKTTTAEVKKMLKDAPKVEKNILSTTLSWAIKDCDYDGVNIKNHETYGKMFSNVLLQYMTTFESWALAEAFGGQIIFDYYQTSENKYAFYYRGQLNCEETFDAFEKERKPMLAPKH